CAGSIGTRGVPAGARGGGGHHAPPMPGVGSAATPRVGGGSVPDRGCEVPWGSSGKGGRGGVPEVLAVVDGRATPAVRCVVDEREPVEALVPPEPSSSFLASSRRLRPTRPARRPTA